MQQIFWKGIPVQSLDNPRESGWYTFGMHKVQLLRLVLAGAGVCLAVTPAAAFLATADDIKQQIEEKQKTLQEIESDIARFEAQLREIADQRETLANALYALRLSEQKLEAEIMRTSRELASLRQEIANLDTSIASTTDSIATLREAVGILLRLLQQLGDTSAIEAILSRGSLSALWEENDSVAQVQQGLRTRIRLLEEQKRHLAEARDDRSRRAQQLAELLAQKEAEEVSLAQARREREQLLNQTKNEETAYQALLAQKKAAREAIEAEMNDLAQQLSFLLDPTKLPQQGVLHFPFEPLYVSKCAEWKSALGNDMCITQYFGDTPFAKSGAYNGKGHNGIDFRAPLGTKIYSAGSGVVRATGDTDQVRGCYSYGKWVLIDHPTGISTLYAHLSSIAVRTGQMVSDQTLIGLSGSTGYSTGPHLHFSVFASEGVQVRNMGDFYRDAGRNPTTPCSRGGAVVPVAALSAYLNPLDFLAR
ncbi:MAG: metalloendopeptidase [Candidatus Parcubacteria bacterium]|nr:MAG: metalloendopeptidase [Candidatus Parcubacteria bacterium]